MVRPAYLGPLRPGIYATFSSLGLELSMPEGKTQFTVLRASSAFSDDGEEFPADTPFINGGRIVAEPGGTNLLVESNDFTHSSYSKSAVTLAASPSVDPWGGTNATRVTQDSPTTGFIIRGSVTADFSRSVWVKAADIANVGKTVGVCVNSAEAGKQTTLTASWKRVFISSGVVTSGTASFYVLDFRGASTATSVDIFEGQLVADAKFQQSQIPTSGTTVTRAATTKQSTPINSRTNALLTGSDPIAIEWTGQIGADQTTLTGDLSILASNDSVQDLIYLDSSGNLKSTDGVNTASVALTGLANTDYVFRVETGTTFKVGFSTDGGGSFTYSTDTTFAGSLPVAGTVGVDAVLDSPLGTPEIPVKVKSISVLPL